MTNQRPLVNEAPGAGVDLAVQREAYRDLISRLRDRVPSLVPTGSRMLVVSRGDDELMRLPGIETGHYPQASDGRFAGHYPADSDAAVAHLEALRVNGQQYLLFPQPALWWLDHYEGLRRHLDEHYRELHRDADLVLFELGRSIGHVAPGGSIDTVREAHWRQIASLLDAVLPREAPVILISGAEGVPEELGGRVVVHIPTSSSGGQTPEADGQSPSFALRDAVRAGTHYVVVPHAQGDLALRPVLARIKSRYRLILDHADLCSVFETVPVGGATMHQLRGSSSALVRPRPHKQRRGPGAEA